VTDEEPGKTYRLSDTVNAFDANGYSYRRKIRTGIIRGEFVPAKRGRLQRGILYQTAQPTHIRGLWNTQERREADPIPIPPDLVLCWAVDDEAYAFALGHQSAIDLHEIQARKAKANGEGCER
jgi:hypothetical protein